MCLWLLTACLGMLPANPSQTVVVVGPPSPILVPTTTTTPAPTTTIAPPTTTTSVPPTMATTRPTTAATFAPSTIGMPSIDPRLGTTAAPLAALRVPSLLGYSAPVPSYENFVRFPRERRSTGPENKLLMRLLDNFGTVESGDHDHQIEKRQSCRCVPAGTCTNYGTGTNYGGGLLDVRIATPGVSVTQCAAGQEYCCGTSSSTVVACGTRQQVPTTAVSPGSGQANFGEYPWQAIILTKQNDYVAGGVFIDQFNVLTVTHRLTNYIVSGTAPNIKVRLGEWDAAGTYEPIPYQEYTISRVFSHPSYNPTTLQYDITVLRLASPVPLTPMAGSAPTINRACLPPSTASTYTGQRCWVSGWGKDMFGQQGQYQQILKEVDVPIVDSATCQSQMRAARLGPNFVLDTNSFICAGGEANKDSCTGDGGSGLVCQVNGQWVVVGLVSWGLGCAAANVPAAYVNVAALTPWIQAQVATT